MTQGPFDLAIDLGMQVDDLQQIDRRSAPQR